MASRRGARARPPARLPPPPLPLLLCEAPYTASYPLDTVFSGPYFYGFLLLYTASYPLDTVPSGPILLWLPNAT